MQNKIVVSQGRTARILWIRLRCRLVEHAMKESVSELFSDSSSRWWYGCSEGLCNNEGNNVSLTKSMNAMALLPRQVPRPSKHKRCFAIQLFTEMRIIKQKGQQINCVEG